MKLIYITLFSALLPITSMAKVYKVKSHTSIKSVPLIEAKSYIVYDFISNKILKEKNSDSIRPIASLTKLMTANIFLFYQHRPELCYNQLQETDIDHLKNTHSRLPQGHTFTCDKLLKAMLISSDNMAASALSRSLKNMNKNDFILSMNIFAKKIGMNNTYYSDSSGLSPENTSTAKDLLKLVNISLLNSTIKSISSLPQTIIVSDNGQIIYFTNTNKLIREYKLQADLSKTGFIQESGYNLIYVHKQLCDNKKIGLILLGSTSSNARSQQAMNILKEYQCLI